MTQNDINKVLDILGQGDLIDHLALLAYLVDCNVLSYPNAKIVCNVLIIGDLMSRGDGWL